MKWSKLKGLAEDLLCDALKGRVQYQVVVHRKSHGKPETFRITLDGIEIFRASDIPYNLSTIKRGDELREERKLSPLEMNDFLAMMASENLKSLHAAYDDAEVEVRSSGLFPGGEVKRLLFDYIHMSIEEAHSHEHPIVKALSLFDRRFGKGRLVEIKLDQESELVKQFYKIRMTANKNK